MKRFIVLSILFFTLIIIDQITKSLIESSQIYSFLFLTIKKTHNAGITLGLFQNINSYLRIISISTIYGIALLISLSMVYFIPHKLYNFKIGIIAWIAGITGNIIDRVRLGVVIDFIGIGTSWYFNLADLFQLIGFIIVIYSIFKYERILWVSHQFRKRFKIINQDQLRLIINVVVASLTLCLTLAIFCTTYFYHGLHVINKSEFYTFLMLFLILSIMFTAILTTITILFTNKVTGPIVAFERYIIDLLNGKETNFTLREGDHHQKLISIAEKIKRNLK